MLSSSSTEIANPNEDDILSSEEIITKKVRFKDPGVPPEDVMAIDSAPAPVLSWKDMLVGRESSAQTNKEEGLSFDDSFSLTAQDVKKSIIDGAPSIDFSERVYKLLEQEMATSVALKMLGRNLGITTLHNRLYGIWRPSRPFQLMDIENGYFLAKFQSSADYDKILTRSVGYLWSLSYCPALDN
ncbi:hypothetical protein J1N35_033910 [Gossypium stocksii]|uniref:DUF4283 domain-containing protein n=1 Tax=Gossypium stocksii TaxID=47602 RepID=A0A9D3UR19_9ROSI|nr:hypothetical protein J1N35_033910 [Gossypium stocksii]